MRTIDKIITPANCQYGAPMGRPNIGTEPTGGVKIYDCFAPMNGAYDKGGAYWGAVSVKDGVKPLRVRYTKDLSYVEFYRSYTARK